MGSTTGRYNSRFHEITPPRLVWNTRIIEARNYRRRNQWKKEHAHHEVHKHTYSRKRQLFPIQETELQRFDFFPQNYMFPVHPEPFDQMRSRDKVWLPHKRDPTVGQNGKYPENYVRFHCSEDMTKYDVVEYLTTIYEVEVVHVDLEKVEEQAFVDAGGNNELRFTPGALTANDANGLGHNDRFKIAHVLLAEKFDYPDFKNEEGDLKELQVMKN